MIKRITRIILVFTFIIATYNVVSKAAISASSKTVNSEEEVSILVTSDIQLSAYTVKATAYNGLTFITSSGGSGAGTTSISDAKATGGMTSLATFKFKAPTVSTDQTFQVTFSATGMGDVDLNAVKDSTCVANVTVKAKTESQSGQVTTTPTQQPVNTTNPSTTQEKSNVATLSDLGIRPNDFKGFKANTYSYNVEVPNSTESIEVYANPAKGLEKKQKISGTGTKTLKEGTNAFEVVVTAEDGKTKKTYTINVTRKAEDKKEEPEERTPEEIPQEDLEEPMEEIFGLSELKFEGLELKPQFKTDIYEYKIELNEDIDKIDITTVSTEINSSVEITGNENLVEGENIITIIVTGEDGEKTATYQIIVNKSIDKIEETDSQNKIKNIIIVSVAVVIIILIIIIVTVSKINQNKKHNEFESYEDEEYNNEDENEFYQEEPKKKKRSKGKRFK